MTDASNPATDRTPEREITLRWYDALVHLVQCERPLDDRRVDIHERFLALALACCQITRRRLETSLS